MKRLILIIFMTFFSLLSAMIFYTKDGKKIDGEFLGNKKDLVYIQVESTLYIISKNNLKRVERDYLNVTEEIFAVTKLKKLNWNSIEETVKIIDRNGKKERTEKKKRKESDIRKISKRISRVSNLRIVENDTTSVLLSWDVKRKKNRLDHFFIDKRIGDGNWIENYAKINNQLTTFEDTNMHFNVPVYYLVGARYKTKISPVSKIKKSFILKDDFIIQEGYKFNNKRDNKDIILTYDIAVSEHEITNKEYTEMLNFAHKRQLLTGDYKNNITVMNQHGASVELLDLDDPDCKIHFDEDLFRTNEKDRDLPVVEVTWFGAAFYCNIISEKLRDETEYIPVYDLSTWKCSDYQLLGYRLPTEAEWEAIAKEKSDKRFPWGNSLEIENVSNTAEIEIDNVAKVGRFSPYSDTNKGVSDLIGNVSEWCDDWYAIHPDLSDENPVNTSITRYKSLRGGSWQNKLSELSNEFRDKAEPKLSFNNIGFRVVRPVVKERKDNE